MRYAKELEVQKYYKKLWGDFTMKNSSQPKSFNLEHGL